MYFTADRIYHRRQFCQHSALAVSNSGQVVALLPRSDAQQLSGPGQLVDFGPRILAPGWVDLQVNGCGGGLFNRDLSLDCLEKILRSSLRSGATSILPTLITCSDEHIRTALEVVRQAQERGQAETDRQVRQLWQGIVGMHLEGPYISAERRGAHPERLIRPLGQAMLRELEAASGVLSYITVGAESVSPAQVARLAASGLTVSLGHTAAPAQESRALLRAGARCFTHLYNGMGGIDSRQPHTLSLALEDGSAYSGIIADGYHVATENIRLAQRLLQQRLFLITDATADDSEQQIFFGEQNCYIQEGAIRNEEGSLAGSALTMKRGVEILAALFGLPTALAMASINPVQALHPGSPWHTRIGSFAPGCRANFVVFAYDAERSQISQLETWVLGQRWQD